MMKKFVMVLILLLMIVTVAQAEMYEGANGLFYYDLNGNRNYLVFDSGSQIVTAFDINSISDIHKTDYSFDFTIKQVTIGSYNKIINEDVIHFFEDYETNCIYYNIIDKNKVNQRSFLFNEVNVYATWRANYRNKVYQKLKEIALNKNKKPVPRGLGPMRGSLDKEQIALGGIYFRSTKSDVRKIHGEPSKIENDGYVYWYGNSFYVKFIMGTEIGLNQPGAYTVVSMRKNKIKTPAGIAVGMNVSSMIKAYGEADRVVNFENGDIGYQYWDKDYSCTCLYFLVHKNKITQIMLYYYV